MMLSRVAERVYWMARYLERAEDTARLVDVYTSLLLDLPRQLRLGWDRLVTFTGADALYAARGGKGDERSVVGFLLTERENPSSVISCLAAAREHVRTTREVLPAELWEAVNGLHRYARAAAATGPDRGARHGYLSRIVQGGQHITGMLLGSMSRDATYDFTRLGRMLERADMTTRIMDVGAAAVPAAEDSPAAQEGIVWIHVLRAQSAYQAYRQRGRLGADSATVASFLLNDPTFPRSVRHCITEMGDSLARLPHGAVPAAAAAALLERIGRAALDDASTSALLALSDEIQVALGVLHERIAETWFRVDRDTAAAPSP